MDDPGTFGKYDFKLFFLVKVGTSLIRGDQKVGAKVVFSPRTGSGWNGWMTFFQVGEVLVFP